MELTSASSRGSAGVLVSRALLIPRSDRHGEHVEDDAENEDEDNRGLSAELDPYSDRIPRPITPALNSRYFAFMRGLKVLYWLRTIFSLASAGNQNSKFKNMLPPLKRDAGGAFGK
jgi:hypothetical protein